MLTFLGDVFPKEQFTVTADLPGAVVLNLESPLTEATVGYPGKINLRGAVAHLEGGFARLPAAVSLANNHVMDFGETGLHDTLAALDRLGIVPFGVGTPGDGFRNPAVIGVAGLNVALLGYAHESSTPVFPTADRPGAARLEPERVVDDIVAARERGADRVVINAHWGEEQVTLPPPRCVELARAMVEAGADLVIGHHAHCIQSYEVYRGTHVFYGLGNCVFPAHQSPAYYGADGQPTRTVDSRPSPRNRRSLAVTYAPATGAVTITPLYFAGAEVRRGRFDVTRFRLELPTLLGYQERYRRSYRIGKLRHTVGRFMSKPTLPTAHHLEALSRLFRTAPPR